MLDLDLRLPAELGGDGRGTYPEQLFAAGFAASRTPSTSSWPRSPPGPPSNRRWSAARRVAATTVVTTPAWIPLYR
jgi:hypothetical protein